VLGRRTGYPQDGEGGRLGFWLGERSGMTAKRDVRADGTSGQAGRPREKGCERAREAVTDPSDGRERSGVVDSQEREDAVQME